MTVTVLPPILQALAVIFRVDVAEPPDGTVTGLTVNVMETPPGPLADKVTLPANLFRLANVTVTETALSSVRATMEGLTLMLKSGGTGTSFSLAMNVDHDGEGNVAG